MAKQFATAIIHSMTLVTACAFLAPAVWARQANANDFSAYLVQGYQQMSYEAGRSADGATLSSYFKQRSTLVAKGILAPEDPEGHALDTWTLRESAFARRQLVERLDAGARQTQPLLAAIAQVNFDCWVAPAPQRIVQPDRDECRRRFYFAFAGLMPADRLASNTASQTAPPAPVVVLAPVVPQTTPLGVSPVQPVAPTQSAEATPQDCGENCVIAAFTGPAADALISKLRQNGSDHGSDSSGLGGTNEGSRAGANAAASSTGSAAASSSTGTSGSSGGQSSASSDSSSSDDSASASNSSDSQNSSSSDQADSGPGKGHGKGHGKGRGKGP